MAQNKEEVRKSFEEHLSTGFLTRTHMTHLRPFLYHLDKQGMLGKVIVDAGSSGENINDHHGTAKRTYFSPRGKQVIRVDFAFKEAQHRLAGNVLNLRADLEEDPTSFAARRKIVSAKRFLGERKLVDTALFCDVLNYVDYSTVLKNTALYIKPGGRIVISNLIGAGNSDHFSPNGPKQNSEITRRLEELGFEIEHATDYMNLSNRKNYLKVKELPSKGMIVIVARKKEQKAD